MDSPLHITGIFGKNLYANVQVPKQFYSFFTIFRNSVNFAA